MTNPPTQPVPHVIVPARKLRLVDAGPNKLHVLMLLRAHVYDFARRPIPESKKRIESPPVDINYNRYDVALAELLRRELKSLGAKVEESED